MDLPTLTKKDEEDLVQWGVPNDIDLIAASFVRKKSDIEYIRKVRVPGCKYNQLEYLQLHNAALMISFGGVFATIHNHLFVQLRYAVFVACHYHLSKAACRNS